MSSAAKPSTTASGGAGTAPWPPMATRPPSRVTRPARRAAAGPGELLAQRQFVGARSGADRYKSDEAGTQPPPRHSGRSSAWSCSTWPSASLPSTCRRWWAASGSVGSGCPWRSPPEWDFDDPPGEVYPDGARLALAMISTPGHWVFRRRQRRALPAWFSLWPVLAGGVLDLAALTRSAIDRRSHISRSRIC